MKRFLVAMLLVTGYLLGLNGQSSFKPGVLITLEQDTVYGLIKIQGELRNSTICTFKATENAPEEEYLPGSLNGYITEQGRFYVSRKIEIDNESYLFFLEYLVDGIYDLFYANCLGRDRYFLESRQGEIYELSNEEEEVIIQGNRYVRDSEIHKRVMGAVFADAPEVAPSIAKAEMNHKSLINITKTYHEITCKDEQCIVYVKSNIQVKVRIGPSFGVYYANLNSILTDDIYSAVIGNNYFAGIAVKLEFPRRNDHISFDIAADYATLYIFKETSSGGAIITDHIYMDQIKFKLGPSYHIAPINRFGLKVGVSAGLQANYYTNYNGLSKREAYSASGVSITYSDANLNMNPLQVGAYAGFGFEYPIGMRIIFLKSTYDFIMVSVDNENLYKFMGFGFSAGFLF